MPRLLGLIPISVAHLMFTRKVAQGFELTRKYIEVDLNEKYKSIGIRWSVVDEQRLDCHYHWSNDKQYECRRNHHGYSHGRIRNDIVLHHISIFPVDPVAKL